MHTRPLNLNVLSMVLYSGENQHMMNMLPPSQQSLFKLICKQTVHKIPNSGEHWEANKPHSNRSLNSKSLLLMASLPGEEA